AAGVVGMRHQGLDGEVDQLSRDRGQGRARSVGGGRRLGGVAADRGVPADGGVVVGVGGVRGGDGVWSMWAVRGRTQGRSRWWLSTPWTARRAVMSSDERIQAWPCSMTSRRVTDMATPSALVVTRS